MSLYSLYGMCSLCVQMSCEPGAPSTRRTPDALAGRCFFSGASLQVWSAFREPSFGHGILTLNSTDSAQWRWNRNLDSSDAVIGDKVRPACSAINTATKSWCGCVPATQRLLALSCQPLITQLQDAHKLPRAVPHCALTLQLPYNHLRRTHFTFYYTSLWTA